jgi:tetratricopeptide (TPR) repeat protein
LAWRARREPELDNIRIAIAWAIDREDPSLIAPYIDGVIDEAHVLWSKMGRPATRAVPFVDRFDPPTNVSLLMLASLEAYMLGDMSSAIDLGEQAGELATELDVALVPGLLRIAFMNAYAGARLLERGYRIVSENPQWVEGSELAIADQARTYGALAQYAVQVRRDPEAARRLAERALALALNSRNPSTVSLTYFTTGTMYLAADPDRALADLEQSITLHESGPLLQLGGALYSSALLLAQRGEVRIAIERLRKGIEFLYERGRSPELDGAFGFAIEILALLGHGELAAVIVGSVFDGALQLLRAMPMPPGRSPLDVRALREYLGRERFNALVAQGAAMTYDELVDWTLASLAELETHLDGR